MTKTGVRETRVKKLGAQRNVIHLAKICRFVTVQMNIAIWTWCEKQTDVRDRTRRANKNTSSETKEKDGYHWTNVKKKGFFSVLLTLCHVIFSEYLFKTNF